MNNQKLKIEVGTTNFWIKENTIIFNDNKMTPIININPEGGSIFIVKDDDNKLKVFYVVLGKGRVDLETDVSALKSDEKHMITYTWNLQEKSLVLYIDGKEVTKQSIPF